MSFQPSEQEYFHFCTRCDQELFWYSPMLSLEYPRRQKLGYWTAQPDSDDLIQDLIHMTCADGGLHIRQTMLLDHIYSELEMIIEDLSA